MTSRTGPVHVATTTRAYKGRVYKTHLLRRSYREGGKVKNETVGNLSHLPEEIIEVVRRSLAGERAAFTSDIETIRTLPHGHVAAVMAMMAGLGVMGVICPEEGPRKLIQAMVVARVLEPGSKLESVRWWKGTTLPQECDLADVDENDVYEALDWLASNQVAIEDRLAARELQGGMIVLYDISSSYFTGTKCSLAKRGYSRDHRRDLPQIVYGVLATPEGKPVAVEVFDGNTRDDKTVMDWVRRCKERFGLEHLIFVGDRGCVTQARVDDMRKLEGVDWIGALPSSQLKVLRDEGHLQLGLFDDRNLMEVTSPAFPGERLVLCRNPFLAKERTRKREVLLAATEAALEGIRKTVEKGLLKDIAKIGMRVGRALERRGMKKHFEITIGQGTFSYSRNVASVNKEAAMDGFYAIRTSLTDPVAWPPDAVVRQYKTLSKVERIFRSMKTTRLLVRPIYHHLPNRVRGHVFLCLLATYVTWHLEQALEPFLFKDPGLDSLHHSEDPVLPAKTSDEGKRKKATATVANMPGESLHSFKSLMDELATLTLATHRLKLVPGTTWTRSTLPTPFQQQVLHSVGLDL